MMDNYPPGAAHDPNAPYNEEPCPDIDVTVRATLVKDTVLTTVTAATLTGIYPVCSTIARDGNKKV